MRSDNKNGNPVKDSNGVAMAYIADRTTERDRYIQVTAEEKKLLEYVRSQKHYLGKAVDTVLTQLFYISNVDVTEELRDSGYQVKLLQEALNELD